mmetsp:Transcript_16247/g.41166  ORF Transcript_16247/g.41166 Transcript_16247/m.41166 type:complete len:102 (-) Transcript_16247:2038-2343(-)
MRMKDTGNLIIKIGRATLSLSRNPVLLPPFHFASIILYKGPIYVIAQRWRRHSGFKMTTHNDKDVQTPILHITVIETRCLLFTPSFFRVQMCEMERSWTES